MDEKDWSLLKILNEEQSINKAAKRLFFSQPTLSAKIKQLEHELACKIIVRSVRGIRFTPQGEMLCQFATRFLHDFQQIKDDLHSTNKSMSGTLCLGCSNTFAKYALPDILQDFFTLYPGVNLQLKTGASQKIFDLLHGGYIQLAIMRGDYPWSGQKKLLRQTTYYIVNTVPLNLTDLPKLPMIHRQLDRPLQDAIRDWWTTTFKEPPLIHIEVDNYDLCAQMVKKGLGYAILPGLSIHAFPSLWSQPLTYPDGSLLTRSIWAYLNENYTDNHLVKTFYNFLIQKDQANLQANNQPADLLFN